VEWITRTWWFKATLIAAVLRICFVDTPPEVWEIHPPDPTLTVIALAVALVGVLIVGRDEK